MSHFLPTSLRELSFFYFPIVLNAERLVAFLARSSSYLHTLHLETVEIDTFALEQNLNPADNKGCDKPSSVLSRAETQHCLSAPRRLKLGRRQ
jgi:hypothetical protein